MIHVFLLILTVLTLDASGHIGSSTMAFNSNNEVPFHSVAECEAAFAPIAAEAPKHADTVRALGHVCIDMEIKPNGTPA